MSNAMKKLKAEAELKKLQCLELEKWTICVIDGVQQEPVHRSEQRAIQTPIFGQQKEVSYCSGFLFSQVSISFDFLFEKPHSYVGDIYIYIFVKLQLG